MKIWIFLLVTLLCWLVACGAEATPTPTLEPTPTFEAAKYGTAVTDLTYCEPEGKPQKMDIYYPSSGGPWPVLLYVHGGSWLEGDKAEGAGWRGMNDKGFLVAAANYRMAAEGKFPVMIEDVQCAVRFLRANSAELNINSDQIGAIGASAGGHLVALLGTANETAGWGSSEYEEQSSRVQAVVSMAGLSDFTVELPSGINTAIYYAFGALTGSDSPKMATASPVTYISSDDPPFLLLHGNKDGVVPIEQSEIFQQRLTAAGVPSTLVIVQHGDHSLQGTNASPTSDEIFDTIVMFLETNLKR